MGHWGVGTDEGDGPADFLDALLPGAGAAALQRPGSAARSATSERAVRAAAKKLALPEVGGVRPSLTDTAGAVLAFLRHGHGAKVPLLALRLAEVALERELLPEVLRHWAKPRAAQVRAELRLVQAEIARRRPPRQA